MKLSPFAIILLYQVLTAVYVVAVSDCMCDGNESMKEMFLNPADSAPLDLGCLKSFTGGADLQLIHNMAVPKLAHIVAFRTTALLLL